MQANSRVRPDQIEDALSTLRDRHKAFISGAKRLWVSADDAAKIRQGLEDSVGKAEQILACWDRKGPRAQSWEYAAAS